jgi:putative hydrolase of the HAD superfamily
MTPEVIAFDADDTLWHSESLYSEIQDKLQAILSPYASPDAVSRALYDTEMQNLQYYGYGIKSFTLSMIETAIRLSGGGIAVSGIQQILGFAKEMVSSPVDLMDNVAAVLDELGKTYTLMMITKGDLLDQELKIHRSGLGDHFTHIEIVRQKTVATYRAVLDRHGIRPQRLLMVGNSLRSDVLPLVELGARAVHIPYHITWAHEAAQVDPSVCDGYVELQSIDLLPAYIQGLSEGDPGSLLVGSESG